MDKQLAIECLTEALEILDEKSKYGRLGSEYKFLRRVGKGPVEAGGRVAISQAKIHRGKLAVAAVVGAALYGAKKIYDKYKGNKEKAKDMQRKQLFRGLAKCQKSKDPKKCKDAIGKKIASIK